MTMPLAIHQVMIVMRMVLLLLAALLLSPLLISPTVEAAPPRALQLFPREGKSSLNPGEDMTFSWTLSRDVSEFLFYYDVAGGAEPSDVLDVYIDEAPYWDSMMGKGWTFCDGCQFSAGTYTVTASTPPEATGPVEFSIGFYLVPQPPVDFAGFIPFVSSQPVSDFGVLFPESSTSYTFLLGATGGSYDFFIDGTHEGTIAGSTTLTLDPGGGFHLFEIDAGASEADVAWTVQIQGPPKLEVNIVNSQSGGCDVTLNPESGQSVCVAGAVATASDGGSPTVTYLWTKSGGELNSTTGQWIRWTAPAGVATYTLTVEASAPGYLSDSDSLSVQVVPEFPPLMTPMLLLLILALVAFAQRKTRNLPSR